MTDDPKVRDIISPKDGEFTHPVDGYRMFVNEVLVTTYPTPFRKGDRIRSERVQ